MKKILTSIVVAIVAITVNAASVDWSFSAATFQDANFENIEGSIAFYLSSDLTTPLTGSPLAISGGEASGVITGTDQTSWTARITISNFDGESASYFYDYIFDMDSVTHAGSPDAATYLAALGGEVATALTLDGALDLYASPASQGFTAAVPEPTSGLLILLGMAGLALKRKRA